MTTTTAEKVVQQVEDMLARCVDDAHSDMVVDFGNYEEDDFGYWQVVSVWVPKDSSDER